MLVGFILASSAKRKLEAELITSKNQLSRMQDKIASLEIEAKRAKIEYEKQLSIKLDQKVNFS